MLERNLQSRTTAPAAARFKITTTHLLVAILIGALALRFYGLNWDQGYPYTPHPDERAILMKVASLSWPADLAQFLDAKSPLNPHWFPYGSFPLYLIKLAFAAFSYLGRSLAELDMRLVGRAISALFDTGTVLLVYLLGARLYGRRQGLLAAAFLGFTVLDIQLSHFYTVDTLLTFFITLTILFTWDIAERCSYKSAALAGLSLGLALATKISVLPLLLTVFTAYVLFYAKRREGDTAGGKMEKAIGGLSLTLLVAIVTFVIAEPYAVLDNRAFISDTVEQSEMVRRVRDYPYTRQYENTAPYLYHVEQLAKWGMGLPLGVVGWGGFLFMLLSVFLRPRRADILLLSWFIPYFLITGGFGVKFMRYMLPLIPLLCLMAVRLLLVWHEGGRRSLLPYGSVLAKAAIVIVLLFSALYSLAYMNIYANPHPAVQVSNWINAHVPKGAMIVREHWEEAIPRLDAYRHGELNLYEADDARKLQHIVERLRSADYLVFYSNRLYGTIPRLPHRYPMTSRYYQLLFSGELGFELEHFAATYPSLLGITFVDDTFSRPNLPIPAPLKDFKPTPITINGGYADESFSVYDHPKVLLFKKVRSLSEGELTALLQTPAPVADGRQPGLLLPEADWKANREGGTWVQLFQRDSLANRFPALSWLLLVEVISIAALPLTFMLFRPLPDRGYLLAKPLGILIVSYLTWLAASLHLLPFSRWTVLLSLVAVALLSGWLCYRFREELLVFLRRRWGILLLGEAIFLLAFISFYVIRLLNPDLWHPYRGGEKPMDFAYLNAIIKTTYLPPYDPWFSGGYLNYYYLGQYVLACLIKFLGIVPAVAFNLAVPLLFALTVGGAFSVVYNLVEVRRGGQSRAGLSTGPVLAALAGAVTMAILSNLDGLFQLVEGFWRVGESILKGSPPLLTEASRVVSGIGKVVLEHKELPGFDYWRGSRMMPPTISITEFPFFTFLFADLHAHLIAMPFALLASALGLSLVVGRGSRHGWGWLWLRGAQLMAFSLVLGSLRWMNTWDYPTYFLIASAAIVVVELLSRRKGMVEALVWGGAQVLLLYLLSTLLYLPFQMSYQSFYSGVQPSQERTPLYQYLAIHALFIFIIASYLVWQLRLHLRWLALALCCLAAAVIFAFAWLVLRLETVAFLGALLVLLLTLLSHRLGAKEPHARLEIFVLTMLGIAFALGIGVDIITIQGDINRMNTVFKFYLQAWVLFSLVSAFALWQLLRLRWWGKRLWLGGLAVLILSSAIYPVAATPVRLKDRFNPMPPTDDGMAYMRQATYGDEKGKLDLVWDYEAIRWMQDNIQGSPVILEGITPLYRWGSRISIYTGLPTVIGWDWHQAQQRMGYRWMVEERLKDVRVMFTGNDVAVARELLKKYEVRYIYVGQLERAYFPAAGLAKFDKMVGDALELAYENREVKIYRVKEGSL